MLPQTPELCAPDNLREFSGDCGRLAESFRELSGGAGTHSGVFWRLRELSLGFWRRWNRPISLDPVRSTSKFALRASMGQGDPGDPGDLSRILHLEHKEYPNKT